MNILYFLIPAGLLLLSIGVALFFWATGNGQFEDLDTPAVSILFDNDKLDSHE